MRNVIVGNRYGHVVVAGEAGRRITNAVEGRAVWRKRRSA